MPKQIFFRMEVTEEERAVIQARIDAAGDSFSNVARQMFGLPPKSKSASLKGNLNAVRNMGDFARELRDALGSPETDPHGVEKRFANLLNCFGDGQLFMRAYEWFAKMFEIHKINVRGARFDEEFQAAIGGDEKTKMRWSRHFWNR